MALTANDPNYITKALIAQYLSGASDTSPVKSWSQGAARIVQGLMGGILAGRDQQDQQAAMSQLGTLLTPNTTASPPIPPPSGGGIISTPLPPLAGKTAQTDTGDVIPLPPQNPLAGLSPQFRDQFPALRTAAADRGVTFDAPPPGSIGGVRTPEQQQALYNQGRTAPGPIVTGTMNSNHLTGNALDVVPTGGTTDAQVGNTVTDLIKNDPRFAGMRSGATFSNLYDPLHVERNGGTQLASNDAQLPAGARPIASQPGAPQQIDIKQRIAQLLSSDNPYAQRLGQQLAIQAISPALSPPKFQQVGQTILGQPQYGWVDAATQKVTPFNGGGDSGGIMPGMPGGDNKAIYEQLPKAQQSIVDNMLAGRQPLPSSFALRTPYWNTLIAAANERASSQGTNFDAVTWSQRNKTAMDFSTGGKSGQTINALDTVQKHIAKTSDDVESLDNGGWTRWNNIRNGIASSTPLDPERRAAVQRVGDDLKAVNNEMARAYRSGAMSDSEVKDWQERINTAQSKEAQRQALADFTDLLNSKRQTLMDQHKRVMGVAPKGPNDAENERITKLVHDRNAGVSSSNPAAQSTSGVTPAAAGFTPPPNWQFSPSRKQYRDPQGNLYDQNGQTVK